VTAPRPGNRPHSGTGLASHNPWGNQSQRIVRSTVHGLNAQYTLMDTSKLLQLAIARKDNNTIALTFSDHRYKEVLLNWLIGLNRLGITNYFVVSLDEEIHAFLSERGFPSFLSPLQGTLSNLWALRIKIFRTLCAADINFIHSDTDAIWLRNPIPEYFGASDHHIIASSGTVWPSDVVKTQGFVFCCGLFYMKGCAQTLALMEEVSSDVAVSGDDQVSLNKVIQRRQINWDSSHRHSYTLTYDGQRFLCFKDMISGLSRDQQLKVGLLPHHLFQRLHMPGHDAYVKHLLSDKDSESKLDMFERTDCRLLAADWQEQSFSAKVLEIIDKNGQHSEENFGSSVDCALPKTADCERTHWTAEEHLARYGPNFNNGMAEYIARTLKPASILEFGCGLGLYCHFLKTQLDVKTVLGIEPEPMGGVFDAPGGPTQVAIDLFSDKHPQPLERKFDLVMSIEVAEHIPREKHDFLFDFLVSHTSNWIVFSGARVGQGGHGHIAERNEEDWKAEFLKRGMIFEDELTRNIRLACDSKNINHRQNLMVFKRLSGYEELDHIEKTARPYLRDILALVQQKSAFLDGNLFYVNVQDAINAMPSDSLKEKRRNLIHLIKGRNNVLEIGFNAGHSALIMLLANRETMITVIDTCQHAYTEECFSYLNRRFPGRLELIKGDSTKVIQELNGRKFDLIHYDGGKEKTITEDLKNSIDLVEDDHVLLIDDTQNGTLNDILLGLEEQKLIDLSMYQSLSERTDKYKWRHAIATFRNSDQYTLTESIFQRLE